MAVISGTATAVSNRVSRRQANRWSQDDQWPQQERRPYGGGARARPARPAQAARRAEGLGILTDAEFEAQKAKILAGA